MSIFRTELTVLNEVDSTNEEIKRRAGRLFTGSAVLAFRQTAGKGRYGREFETDKDKSLCLSVYYDEADPLLTAKAAVCVLRTLQKMTGLKFGIKWPNDILFENKKICGILAETAGKGMVLGIGINVDQRPDDFSAAIRDKATSLLQTDPRIDCSHNGKLELAGVLLGELKAAWEQDRAFSNDIIEEYRSSCVTLGKTVRVRYAESRTPRIGTALDINDDFSINIRWEDGSISTAHSGEIQIRGINGYI